MFVFRKVIFFCYSQNRQNRRRRQSRQNRHRRRHRRRRLDPPSCHSCKPFDLPIPKKLYRLMPK